MILATCFAPATTEDSQECAEGVLYLAMFEKIVAALPQSLQKVELSSTFHNACGNEKIVLRPLQGMLHEAMFCSTCVATKLQDKLHETLPSVTPP